MSYVSLPESSVGVHSKQQSAHRDQLRTAQDQPRTGFRVPNPKSEIRMQHRRVSAIGECAAVPGVKKALGRQPFRQQHIMPVELDMVIGNAVPGFLHNGGTIE